MSEIKIVDQDEVSRLMAEARRIRSEHFMAGVLRIGRTITGFAFAIAEAFAEARRQHALYQSLSRMTDLELRDIGLNRSEIPAVVAGVRTREIERAPETAAVSDVESTPAAPSQADERIAA